MSARPPRRGDYEALLASLLSGSTVRTAAERAGMSERAAYRFLEADGRHQLDQMRAERRARIVDALSSAAAEATAVLRRVMLDRMESTSVRVAAAKVLLAEHRGVTETALKERLATAAEDAVDGAAAALDVIRRDPALTAQVAAAAHAVEDALQRAEAVVGAAVNEVFAEAALADDDD